MDPSTRTPTPDPGERRRSLERPPGDRYASPALSEEAPALAAGPPAAVVAVGIALGGALVTVLLGGVLSLSVGLLVVAGGTGWLVGRALGARAGSGRPRSAASGPALAVGLAVASVVVGHLGLWLFARSEGGALGLLDYLAQTWGPLAVGQYVVAAVAAWLASR